MLLDPPATIENKGDTRQHFSIPPPRIQFNHLCYKNKVQPFWRRIRRQAKAVNSLSHEPSSRKRKHCLHETAEKPMSLRIKKIDFFLILRLVGKSQF